MLTKTHAIVLHSLKYGDTRMIVDMFTKKFGRLAFIVSIPKSTRSKIKKQFFQPLSLLEVKLDFRPRLQLQRLSDARWAPPFASIPFDPHKLAISLFLSEFLCHALRSEQQNEPLFEYLESGIQWLDGQDGQFSNFHLVFLMRLSRFLGFYPNLEHYSVGFYFDLRESIFLPQPPVHRDFLGPEEAGKVQLMMRMDFATMHLFRMSHGERQRLLEVALTYYRLHLPDFPEMKSINVLRELYAD